MTRVVEFIGGPLDGECVTVPDGATCYRVMLPEPIHWAAPNEHPPLEKVRIRDGIYRGLHRYFFWEGER